MYFGSCSLSWAIGHFDVSLRVGRMILQPLDSVGSKFASQRKGTHHHVVDVTGDPSNKIRQETNKPQSSCQDVSYHQEKEAQSTEYPKDVALFSSPQVLDESPTIEKYGSQ